LAHLEQSLPSLANASMAVKESGDDVTFLRKLVPGAASSSYGIYCARLAGLPEQIIGRAYELLHAAAVPLDEAAAASETSVRPSDDAVRETTKRYDGPQGRAAEADVSTPASGSGEVVQLSMFGMESAAPAPKSKKTVQAELVAEQLRQLDLFNLTPMQAMQWLNDMKKKLAESAR
jgi:DNA mismatch repair protein MutS